MKTLVVGFSFRCQLSIVATVQLVFTVIDLAKLLCRLAEDVLGYKNMELQRNKQRVSKTKYVVNDTSSQAEPVTICILSVQFAYIPYHSNSIITFCLLIKSGDMNRKR